MEALSALASAKSIKPIDVTLEPQQQHVAGSFVDEEQVDSLSLSGSSSLYVNFLCEIYHSTPKETKILTW